MRGLIHGLLAAGVLLGIPGTVLAAEGAPAVDTGDTAWVLISAALVMLMTPGLAFFYGGMVRSKNVTDDNYAELFICGDGKRAVGAVRFQPCPLGRILTALSAA